MIDVRETEAYAAWFSSLKDKPTRARISIRIRRLSLGNPGRSESVGGGVFELKFDFGPGWRVYYTEHGKKLVFLLGGGDKSSQDEDIKTAKELAKELRKTQ
jgi:putative addiction module killer protein